jgi:hypothetical protein
MLPATLTALGYAADAGAPAPVQSVITPYLQIHDALAKDSHRRSVRRRIRP